MKQSSKRLMSMLVALVFLVAAFVGFFDFVEPAYSDVQDLRGKAIADQDFLTSLTALVKQAQSLISDYNAESSSTTGISLALPSGEDMAGALAQIEGVAQNNHLSITTIAISTPVLQPARPVDQAGNVSSTQSLKPAGNFSLKVTAAGSYKDFKNFLAGLETNIRLFDATGVSLQPFAGSGAAGGRPSSLDQFTYNVTIQTYYQLP